MSFKRDFECPTGWNDCGTCASLKGQKKDGAVVCGRRPRQFKCLNCGGQKFTVVRRQYTVADFSREGAVEGHPVLESGGGSFDSIFCDECSEPVEGKRIQEMLREIV